MSKALIKKNLLTGLSAIALSVTLTCSYGMTAQASEPVAAVSVVAEEAAAPRSAIIDWRYKGVDGKLYKRLYNYTEQCWVGDWILCP